MPTLSLTKKIERLAALKREGAKIAALTAYDYPTARLLDESGVDLILVGDSLGMVVCGLAMAPIFPTLIATTPERVGLHHTGNVVGFQIAAATLGASLVPAATGVAVARFGLEAVAPAVLAGAVALAGLHEILVRIPQSARDAQPIG